MKDKMKDKGMKQPNQKAVNARRRRLVMIIERGTRVEAPAVRTAPRAARTAVIFRSEYDYLCRCILDRSDIETGGQLFGYWTEDGTPVVLYAIGPGPRANHQQAFFNQDVDYLVTVGRALKNRYGLHHIGEWHSHHRLGLARPSGHDARTMNSTIREKNLGRFLLCIGNCTATTATVGAFLCDGTTCADMGWSVVEAESPLRGLADSQMGGLLVHPSSRVSSRRREEAGERPAYAPGYWLREKGNAAVLNSIIDYVRASSGGKDVRPLLNGNGEVVLRVGGGRVYEDILFPAGFPARAPELLKYTDGTLVVRRRPMAWSATKEGLLPAFMNFYENRI